MRILLRVISLMPFCSVALMVSDSIYISPAHDNNDLQIDAFIQSANREVDTALEKTRMLSDVFENTELCDREGFTNAAAIDLVVKRDFNSSILWTPFDAGEMQKQYSSTVQSGNTIFIDNLGFLQSEGALPFKLPAVEKADPRLPDAMYPLQDALGQNMYHFMATDGLSTTALFGKRVLEVGCGRGKGAAYIAQQFGPKEYIGLDLNEDRVALARKYWGRTPNLRFVAGNAMSLPFEGESFDVVLNVESSFHYPDFDEFVREVHRVLSPGGTFIWTAPLFKRGEDFATKKRSFENAGFRVDKSMNIVRNVISARQRWAKKCSSTELNLACATVLYDIANSTRLRSPVNFWEFFALPRSTMYKTLDEGKVPYLRFIASKIEE